MNREIVLLDVTAMQGDHVCIAGLDVNSGQQVRLADPTPTRMLVHKLGDLRPGDLVQVGLAVSAKNNTAARRGWRLEAELAPQAA